MQLGQGLNAWDARASRQRCGTGGPKGYCPAHPRPAHLAALLLICRHRLRFAATCCPIISTIVSWIIFLFGNSACERSLRKDRVSETRGRGDVALIANENCHVSRVHAGMIARPPHARTSAA